MESVDIEWDAPANHIIAKPAAPSVKVLLYNPNLSFCLHYNVLMLF